MRGVEDTPAFYEIKI